MYYMDWILLVVSLLILVIFILVGVAFLTLLERKVLGYIQIRKGPNKVGFMGVFQPFSDAIKLFSKESVFPLASNFSLYYVSPVFNLFLALFLWGCLPYLTELMSFNFSFLFVLCISSLSVYSVLLSGWASNSNYSMLGGMRAVAQSISYEVSLIMILLSFLILVLSFSMVDFLKYQKFLWMVWFCIPLSMVWIVSSLAETNRTPFDFAEGESELVSGFNVEYSSGGFALIFLAEYSNILFMSMLCVILFLGCNLYSFSFFLKIVIFSFFWVWVRGTLPRFRYDKLMFLAWKSYLPISLNLLFFYFGFKVLLLSVLL